MWTLLTFVTLAQAQALPEPDPPASETAPEQVRPDHALAQIDVRYRRGRTWHRVGNVTAATGLGLSLTSSVMRLNECSWPLGGCDLTVGSQALAASGTLLIVGGPVIANAGALQAAGAVRARGGQVERTWGHIGVGIGLAPVVLTPPLVLAIGSVEDTSSAGMDLLQLSSTITGLMPLAAVVSGWLQMRATREAVLGLDGLVVVPAAMDGGAGLAVVGAW